jgi:hypothetical protein
MCYFLVVVRILDGYTSLRDIQRRKTRKNTLQLNINLLNISKIAYIYIMEFKGAKSISKIDVISKGKTYQRVSETDLRTNKTIVNWYSVPGYLHIWKPEEEKVLEDEYTKLISEKDEAPSNTLTELFESMKFIFSPNSKK